MANTTPTAVRFGPHVHRAATTACYGCSLQLRRYHCVPVLLVTAVLCSCVATTSTVLPVPVLLVTAVLCSCVGASATCYGCSLQLHRCQCYLLRLFSAVASVPVLLVTAVLCSCIGASATCYGCSLQLHRCQCYLLRLFSAVASVPVLLVTAVLCSCIGASATCYGCSQQLRRYRCVTVLLVQCYRYQCYVLRLFCAVASLPLCTSGTCTVSSVPVVGVTADLYSFIGASGTCYSRSVQFHRCQW